MFLNLSNLVRYRGLIWSLVARDLKARYRGSVLGFFWTFVNPLLLLLVYSFVFTTIMPNNVPGVKPYALFMFCGILPWNWFSTSLSDAAGSLIAGGNLIKKVLFPAEVLPLVSVLTNMVPSPRFSDPIPFLIYQRLHPTADLLWFPVAVVVAACSASALALILSALAVHFRDIRDILANVLMLWFFATPIIYPWFQANVRRFKLLFDVNPFTHLAVSYQEILFFGPVGHWKWLLALGGGSVLLFLARAILAEFDRLRDAEAVKENSPKGEERKGKMSRTVPVPWCPFVVRDTTVVIDGRHRSRQRLENLPALRRQTVLHAQERAVAAEHHARSSAGRDVPGADRRVLQRAERIDIRRHRTKRIRKEHGAQAGRRHHEADDGDGAGRRADLGAHRARRGISSRDLRPRKRLHQRHHAGPDQASDSRALRRHRRLRRASGIHRCAGQDVLVGHVHAPRIRRGDSRRSDVLLVDEVLAVGDEGFTHKCLDKFAEFRRRGKTVLLVTHSLGLVETLCDEAVWLDGGRLQAQGDPKRVVGAYLTAVEQGEQELMAATTAKAVEEVEDGGDRFAARHVQGR